MKKTILILLSLTIYTINAQSHHFGIKIGYTNSKISASDNSIEQLGNEYVISTGTKWSNNITGFQIGLMANIDIGYDFAHLDLVPQFSSYGFNSTKLNYFDFEIGLSNLNSEVSSPFVAGLGITPSVLISNKDTDIGKFDLKISMLFGYRFYKDFVLFAQMKYGAIELKPKTNVRNFQLSLNLNIPIYKIKLL